MNQEKCPNCGASAFVIEGDYKVCEYCGSKFKEESRSKRGGSTISLQSDIDVLLQKCIREPWNARKYAGLILDIDPTNREAQKYL